MVAYTYNPSTQGTEAGEITLTSKPPWTQSEDQASQGYTTSHQHSKQTNRSLEIQKQIISHRFFSSPCVLHWVDTQIPFTMLKLCVQGLFSIYCKSPSESQMHHFFLCSSTLVQQRLHPKPVYDLSVANTFRSLPTPGLCDPFSYQQTSFQCSLNSLHTQLLNFLIIYMISQQQMSQNLVQNSRAVPVHVMEQTFVDGVILLEFYFSVCVWISSYWPQAKNHRTTGCAVGRNLSFSSLCRTSSCISPIPSLMAFLTSCQETNVTSYQRTANPIW